MKNGAGKMRLSKAFGYPSGRVRWLAVMASPPEGFASLHDPSEVRSATAARSRDEGAGTYPSHVQVSKGSKKAVAVPTRALEVAARSDLPSASSPALVPGRPHARHHRHPQRVRA